MVRPAGKTARWLIPHLAVKGLRDTDFTRGKSKVLLQLLPVLLFIAVWWIVAVVMDTPRLYPTPLMVAERLASIIAGKSELGASSYLHIAATFYRFFVAFVISFVTGAIIGLLIGRNKVLFDLFDNVGWIFFSVPAVLWAFILVVALGITDVVPILVLMALLVPKVAILIAEGAKATPADILEMADSFKATTWQKVKDVFIPHLVPYLVASARVSFSIGVKIIIVAEVIGLTTGIGFMVKYWFDKVFVAPIVAWGLVLIFLAIIAEYALFGRLEKRVTKWRTYGVQTVQERRE
jgi:ABC-type nitrate/sulfonate/bicarbonate transport system permease component